MSDPEEASTNKASPSVVNTNKNDEEGKDDNCDEEALDYEDKVQYRTLNEDMYSVMLIAEPGSVGLWFSIFVFAFQIALILLILFDLIDIGKDNPFRVPPGINNNVRATQAFAVVLAVATQQDLIQALSIILAGYDIDVLKVAPHATCFKWFLSNALHFITGCALLLVIFTLVVQADTVIGMMLNFAALSFVGEIDDVAFQLAKYGFVSEGVQMEVRKVKSLEFPLPRSFNSKRNNCFRKASFAICVIALYASYGRLIKDQLSGRYLCKNLFVQLGDGFNPRLAFFSGLYNQGDKLYNGRVSYQESLSGQLKFAYCEEQLAWTLSRNIDDPCNALAKSSETKTYDIVDTVSTGWFVRDITNANFKPLDHFSMTCNECDKLCQFGSCVNNKCICNDGRYGLNCEFSGQPCPEIVLDQRTNPFPDVGLGRVEFDTTLSILINPRTSKYVEAYNRPVYLSVKKLGNSTTTTIFTVVMFTGRRWVATLGNTFNADNFFDRNMTENFIIDYFTKGNGFHGNHSMYNPFFLSDPMDVGTVTDRIDPVGITWYRAKELTNYNTMGKFYYGPDLTQPVNVIYVCAVCNELNACYNFGACNRSIARYHRNNNNIKNMLMCECIDGFTGNMCERAYKCTDKDGPGCYNGGECDSDTGICKCPSFDYAGSLCQIQTSELSA